MSDSPLPTSSFELGLPAHLDTHHTAQPAAAAHAAADWFTSPTLVPGSISVNSAAGTAGRDAIDTLVDRILAPITR